MSEKKMLSIWFFVGLMLTIFGFLVTLTGVNYIFHPQNQTPVIQAHVHLWWGLRNPNLWWGGIMLIAGLLFLVPSYIHYRIAR